jgi:hypothetical protein
VWFSFILAGGSLLGLWVVGKRPRLGWAMLAVMEVAWVVWSLRIGQLGLGLLCAAYFGLYCLNLVRARRG